MLTLLYPRLKICWIKVYFSDANSESKSNNSNGGGGNSLKIGGNTAGSNPSKGVSNYGGIKVSYLCSTFSYLYSVPISGTISVSSLNS